MTLPVEELSVPTLAAITEVVTGGSGTSGAKPIGVYRTGPMLEQFLGGAGIELRIGASSRVPAVRDALRQNNQSPSGRQAIRKLIEQVADPREYPEAPERLAAVVERLNSNLRLDGLELRELAGRYKLVAVQAGPATDTLKSTVKSAGYDSVEVDLARALEQADADPEDAVTAACSAIESAFKCILDEMGGGYPAKQDIAGLAKAIEDGLQLSPGRQELEPDIKQILGGLANVSRGIGALRTHSGDAHGRGKSVRRLDARIARLAIHSASTISLFYIETWQKQKKDGKQP